MKCIHGNDMGQSCEHCAGTSPGYRAIEPSALDSMTNTTYVEVPSHRDQLNERLCNELANLSRNIAGLTGVAKTLMEQKEPQKREPYWYSRAATQFINRLVGLGADRETITLEVQNFLEALGLQYDQRPYGNAATAQKDSNFGS